MATKKRNSIPLADTGVDWSAPVGAPELLNPTPAAPEAPPAEPPGLMRRLVGDTSASLARGAVQGVRMLTDLGGADNSASAGLRTAEDYIGSLQSASAKADQQEIARLLQEAEGKGLLDQVVAGAKAFGVAPMQLMAQAVGTSIPTLATALIPGVGQGAIMARTAAGLGMGAAQGTGAVKSSIYDEVKKAATQAGATPDEAERRAVWAQSYSGPNAAQLALGAGLGAWAGRSGIEGALDKLVHGSTKAAPGMLARVGMGALAEGIPEAVQGGQEKFATNTALTNDGTPTDPFSGVAANATMEGLAGKVMGGAFGIPAPRPGDQLRQDKLPETGPMTRALNAAVETAAQKVDAGAPIPADPQGQAQPLAPTLPESLPESLPPEAALVQAGPAEPDTNAAARAQREADKPAEPTDAPQDGDILNKQGRPFMSMDVAMRRLAEAGGEGTHEIKRVRGGLVVRPKAGAEQTLSGPEQTLSDQPPTLSDAPETLSDPTEQGAPTLSDAPAPAPTPVTARTFTLDGKDWTLKESTDKVLTIEADGETKKVPTSGKLGQRITAALAGTQEAAPAVPAPAEPPAAAPAAPAPEPAPAATQASIDAVPPAPRTVTIGDEKVALNDKQAAELDRVNAEYKVKFDAAKATYERTKNQKPTDDPDMGLRSPKERFDAESKRLGMELSAERRRIAGKLTPKEQKAADTEAGRIRVGDAVDTPEGAGTVTGTAVHGKIRVKIGDRTVVVKHSEATKVEAKTPAPAPAPGTSVVDAKDAAPYYVLKPDRSGTRIPVRSPEAAAEALRELAQRTGAKPVDGSIDVYDAKTGLPAFNIRPDGTFKKVETLAEAQDRTRKAVEDERRTVEAPAAPNTDEKARWLKNVADTNRLQGPTNPQLKGLAPNGKLEFLGDPRTTKGGRSLLGAVDEARKAGATDAEIAAAVNQKPAAPAPSPAAAEDTPAHIKGIHHWWGVNGSGGLTNALLAPGRQQALQAIGMTDKQAKIGKDGDLTKVYWTYLPDDVRTKLATLRRDGWTPTEAATTAPAPAQEPDVRTAAATTDRERALRALSRATEKPGDVMLGNDKFVTLEQAKAAAQEAIDAGDLNPAMPFQFNRVLDIAPRDWYRMVKEMTGKAYRDPARGGRPQEPEAPAAAPPAPAPKPQPSANTVFTEDAAAAARARLKAKLGRLNSGLDPETMMDGITLAGYHIEKGARTFAAYARAMVDDLGDGVKPYLQSWYMAVRADPRAAAFKADMDKASAVEDLDVDEVLASTEPASPAVEFPPEVRAAALEAGRREAASMSDWKAKEQTRAAVLVAMMDTLAERHPEGRQGVAALANELLKVLEAAPTDLPKGITRQGREDTITAMYVAERERLSAALQPAMEAAGWAAETGGLDNTYWQKRVGKDRYTARLDREYNPAKMEVTALEASGVETQIAFFDVTDAGKAAAAADKAVTDDQADSGTLATTDQAQNPASKESADDQRRDDAGDAEPLDPELPPGNPGLTEGVAPEAGASVRDPDAPGDGRAGAKRARRKTGMDRGAKPVLPQAPAEVRPIARSPVGGEPDAQNQLFGSAPGNYEITADDGIGEGTEGQKLRANMEAIRTLRRIQQDNRNATPEEQAVMAKFIGWGGLRKLIDPNTTGKQWLDARAELLGTNGQPPLLADGVKGVEWASLQRSTTAAHFTAPEIVTAMWSVVRHFGFAGGRVLEPTSGIGNFIGLQPRDLAAASEWHGAELDILTGQMAKLIYPEASIAAGMGFESVPFAKGAFRLAIGNPPFGSLPLQSDVPAYKNIPRMKIHNFIIAKTGEHLQPGGVMAMVVTHRFLDTANPEAREHLAKDFKFLGAFRLPNDAFLKNASTEVTTDVVFLQRLHVGEKATDLSWLDTEGSIKVDGQDIRVNRYYEKNPGNILGRSAMDGTMYAGRQEKGGEYTVHSDGRDLTQAIAGLLENEWASLKDVAKATNADTSAAAVMIQQSDLPVGGVMLDADGKVLRREMDDEAGNAVVREVTPSTLWSRDSQQWLTVLNTFSAIKAAKLSTVPGSPEQFKAAIAVAYMAKGEKKTKPTQADQAIYDIVDAIERPGFQWKFDAQLDAIRKKDQRNRLGENGYARLKGMVGLRNTTLALIEAERADKADDMRMLRDQLNSEYDAFVAQFGLVNESANAKLLEGDIGVETGLETGFQPANGKVKATAKKADILGRRVNFPYREVTSANDAADGLQVSLSERGRLDIPYIAKLTGLSKLQVINDLSTGESPSIFLDPASGEYVDADQYLSGNVKLKLQKAKEAGLKDNVRALEAVQPEPKTKANVRPSIRGAWMPESLFTEFLADLGATKPKVSIIAQQGMILASSNGFTETEFGSQFKNSHKTVVELFNAAASGKPITIWHAADSNGNRAKNEAATKEVGLLVERMTKVFSEWAWSSDTRVQQVVDAFNEKMNTHVARRFDGNKYLRPVGASPSIELRTTQKNAAWRIVQAPTVLLDHVVGAGKAQPMDAKILTPDGWRLMADIGVGDSVITADGTATTVEAVYPQGDKPIFRVTFSDGASTECCDEHLWLTQTYRERGFAQRAAMLGKDWPAGAAKVRSLAEIRSTLVAPHLGAKNHSIPLVSPVQFNAKPLPLSPYLMGVLLGDGGMSHAGVTVTTADQEIADRCEALLPIGARMNRVQTGDRCATWTLIGEAPTRGGNPVKAALDALDLRGLSSHEKFIPDVYLLAAPSDRIELLRGLMDTDGSVAKGGHSSYFYTTSSRLAAGVTALVQSLGGLVKKGIKKPTYRYNGELCAGRDCHVLCISLPGGINPFALSRKADAVVPKSSYAPARYIVAVEPVGVKPAQCIRVAHGSRLYVTDDYIVTHNTYTIITGAMQRRRLGLSRKPMIVVPNHLVTQWARDFYALYPGAKIMAATPDDFAKDRRRRLFARIATGDFDAVIIGHSSLSFIETPAADQEMVVNEQISELQETLNELKRKKESGRTLTQIQEKLQKYQGKLKELQDVRRDELGIDLEKMGVDYLAVDEMHEFKNLEYATAGERVVGMNDPKGSKKAFDLYLKVRGLLARGGAVTGATGTPVSNSLVELYTMMKYLAHQDMTERNQINFDAWSGAYARTETKLEYTATQKLKPRRVLGGLNNLSALKQLYEQFADVISMADLKRIHAEDIRRKNAKDGTSLSERFPVPNVKTGGRTLESGPITEAQSLYMDYLVARMQAIEANKRNKEYARIDNPLYVLTDARKMSLDIRIVDPTAPRDENGKVMRAAANVFATYKKWDKDSGAQLIFCDLSTPAKTALKDANRLIRDSVAKLFGEAADGKRALARVRAVDSFVDQWRLLQDMVAEVVESPATDPDVADQMESYLAGLEDVDATMSVADIGFSVYDDMREVLIQKGIPEAEIAFIHDYNTPDEKAKLFSAVNEGRIRVLMGSSAKMGAGTNAQRRLVALHHMDAPWRPSDVEQREGRIIRQGNMLYERDPEGFDVDIRAYSTAGTSDAVMWQVLERKARAIEEFRNADLDHTDEEGSDSNQYAEFMAQSTGSPVFRLKLEAEREVDLLDTDSRGALLARTQARDFLQTYDAKIAKAKAAVAYAEKADIGAVEVAGEKGTEAEFEAVMAAARQKYDREFAEYTELKSRANEELAAWNAMLEMERGDKPKMPTAPSMPGPLSKSILAASGYARAIKAALSRASQSGYEFSMGAVRLRIRQSLMSDTDWVLQAWDGSGFDNIGYGTGATADASSNLATALTPAWLHNTVKMMLADNQARVQSLEEQHPIKTKLAAKDINTDKLAQAKEAMEWLKSQVAFAEQQADIRRSERPNRYITADKKRPLSQGRQTDLNQDPVEFDGEVFTRTGFTDGFYVQAVGEDGREVLLRMVLDKSNQRGVGGVVEKPRSVKFSGLAQQDTAGQSTNLAQTGASEANDADVVFSRSRGPSRGVPVDDAKAVIAAIRQVLPKAPPIHLMETLAQAPRALRDIIKAEGAENLEAVYHAGEIYVFPRNIESIERMQFVVGHHEIRHHGIRSLLGAGDNMRAAMLAMWSGNQELRKAAQAKMDAGLANTRVLAVEEALADMPVEEVAKFKGFPRFVAAMRQWLRQVAAKLRTLGMHLLADSIEPKTWTDADVARFLMKAEDVSRNGSPMMRAGGTVFGRTATVQRGTEADAIAAGFTMKAYRGVSKASPLNDTGTTWLTTSLEVAEAYAEDVMGYDDPGVMEVMVRPGDLPRHDASRLTDEQREELQADEFGNPQAVGIYDRSDDHPLGGSRRNVTVIHAPQQAVWVVDGDGAQFSRPAAQATRAVVDKFNDLTKTAESFNWWHKTVGTQYHKAKVNPQFAAVYNKAQEYLHDTSAFANDPADLAPELLPQLRTLGDLKKKLALSKADADQLSMAVIGGTLHYTRTDSGQVVEAGPDETAGVVFTPAELRSLFKFTDRQVTLYQQFRAATDRSLDILVAADVARLLGEGLPPPMKAMISAGDTGRFKGLVTAWTTQQRAQAEQELADVRRRHRNAMAGLNRRQKAALEGAGGRAGTRLAVAEKFDKERAQLKFEQGGEKYRAEQVVAKWADLDDTIKGKFKRIGELKAQGYAPLMRFGRYTVDVVGQDGARQFFGMFESEREANAAARKFRQAAQEDGAEVTQGILSEEAYKQFSGLTPETIELFAEVAGVEKTEVFQQYLRLAKNNRSAMKRLIRRTGVAGFSEDSPRVLAAFLTSNARAASSALHMGELTAAVEDIPKQAGDVKDQAIKLREYVQNPQEEAQAIRSLLFVQYLGGSVASALVNMTQPLMMTLPYLSQFGGPAKAVVRLAAAVWQAITGVDPKTELGRALKLAEKEGITAPQELHQLQAEASRTVSNHPTVRRLLFAWGGFFSLAEGFNRRVSFIAAFNTAKEQKIDGAFSFAAGTVDETQGVYNKGNRPNWARGAVGATLFTFKQYSISYVEFLKRLPKRERALALAILLLAAGAQGIPGADDLDDLIDTLGQHLGYDTNAKLWKARALNEAIGAEAADFVLHGFSALPGIPLDVAGRLGLGNLIPGTGLLLKSKADKTSEVVEAIGPFGSTVVNTMKALPALLSGDVVRANEIAGPTALKNLSKALDMYQTGEYRDMAGRKVVEVTEGDALIKAIGFQPADVARDSRKVQMANQQVGLARNIEAEIASEIAAGIVDKKPEKVVKARERLREWNRANPESRIAITQQQINRRVRDMRLSRDARFIKAAPKELRGAVAEVVG